MDFTFYWRKSSLFNSGMSYVTYCFQTLTKFRLKEWFTTLPECLTMDSTPVMKLNSIGYLRLAYVATEITLHRRIMLALTPSTDPQLQKICRSVAQERFVFAIEFIQSLKPQHLSSFWYFASPQNFALIAVFGTLLLSTAATVEEGDFYKKKLREYRWILKINSENGARYMGPAMKLLDANMNLMNEGKAMRHSETFPVTTSKVTFNDQSTAEFNNQNSINGNQSSAGSYSEESPMSNAHVPSADFASPGQFGFEAPYFPGQHIEDATIVEGGDIHAQDFGYGIGLDNNGEWY